MHLKSYQHKKDSFYGSDFVALKEFSSSILFADNVQDLGGRVVHNTLQVITCNQLHFNIIL